MKKSFGFMLSAGALSLLLLASCGGKKAAANAVDAEPGPLGKYKEPVVLTWGVNTSAIQKFFNGDTYENNAWSRKIKEDLNIDVQIAFTANWETQAYLQQVNLALASGSIPDLLRIDNYRQFREAVDAGLVADITDAFAKYASPELKALFEKYPSAVDYVTVNGRMYGIPPFNGNEQNTPLLWIRDDWLKKVGMQPPKTVEEMVAVARAFTFNDPDGNGKNDTYGLGLQKAINIFDHGSIGGLLAAFGVPTMYYDLYYPGKDGKITSPYIQSEVKEALQILQDMYKEGLIDPEFITTDMTKIQQDVARKRFGMAYGPQYGTWSPWNYAYTAQNNAVTHPYPVPQKAGYTPMYGFASNKSSGEMVVISSRVSNPEAAVKLVNHYIAFNNDWQSDPDRLKYSDNEQYRFNPAWVAEPQEVRVQPILFDALSRQDPSELPPVLLDWYNKVVNFEKNTKGHDADTYGRWGQYALSGSMTIILNTYPKSSMIESLLGALQPESLLTGAASLEKITDQTYTEIITGQKPVSYFDTYVQDWLKAGGQKILDDLEAAYGKGAKK